MLGLAPSDVVSKFSLETEHKQKIQFHLLKSRFVLKFIYK